MSVYDPRQELQHNITVGQVYGDARHENDDGSFDYLYRVVYIDEEYVLMRSNEERQRRDGYLYRGEDRDAFEEQVGAGRMKLTEDSDAPPNKPDDMTPVLAVVNRLKDHYTFEGGRKNQHKAEAMQELLEELDGLEAEVMDWTEAEGVGQQAAENLFEAGYTTDISVQHASDEALLDIGLIGQKNLQNLRDLAEGE